MDEMEGSGNTRASRRRILRARAPERVRGRQDMQTSLTDCLREFSLSAFPVFLPYRSSTLRRFMTHAYATSKSAMTAIRIVTMKAARVTSMRDVPAASS